MKSKIFDIIKRWRHTLGYGVHSPLAYSLVKECVRPDFRYAYYSDSITDSAFADNYRMRANIRMLVRMLNVLRVSRLYMPDCPKKVKEVIAQAYPGIKLARDTKNADFIVVFNNSDAPSFWRQLEEKEEAGMLVLSPSRISGIQNATLTLQGSAFTLFLRRKGMCPVEYTLL